MPASPEFSWAAVAAAAAMTALMRLPHILALIAEYGLIRALKDGDRDIRNPEGAAPRSAVWAQRARRAHLNAVENLAISAPLAIGVHLAGAGAALTAGACAVFVAARAGHVLVCALGLPVIRTVLFFAGVGCPLVFAVALNAATNV